MKQLSKAEVISRLGGVSPEQWEFRGQCYDTGVGNSHICALTKVATRFCFTLKRRDGLKGKATIGPAAFFLLRRLAPKLYIQLERGRLWLQLFIEAEEEDMQKAAMRKNLIDAKHKLVGIRQEARKHIVAWRNANYHDPLPIPLTNLRLLLVRKEPKTDDLERARLWIEQETVETERELLSYTATLGRTLAVPAPSTPVVVVPSEPASTFAPIPEIVF